MILQCKTPPISSIFLTVNYLIVRCLHIKIDLVRGERNNKQIKNRDVVYKNSDTLIVRCDRLVNRQPVLTCQ